MPGLTELPTLGGPNSLDTTRTDRVPYGGETWRVSARLLNKIRTYIAAMGQQRGLGDGTTEGSLQNIVDQIAASGAAPVEVSSHLDDNMEAMAILGVFDPSRFSLPTISFRSYARFNAEGESNITLGLYDLGPANAPLEVPLLRASFDYSTPGNYRSQAITVSAEAGVNTNQILPGQRVYGAAWTWYGGAVPNGVHTSKVWFDVRGTVLGGPSQGGGAGGVRVAEFVVGNTPRGSDNGVDFEDTGDGAGVKAACDAARDLDLEDPSERVRIVVRNGTYTIPPGGFFDACANVDLVAESEGGVTFIAPAPEDASDFRAGILRSRATMTGCNLTLQSVEAAPGEGSTIQELVPLWMENDTTVRGGAWKSIAPGGGFSGVCFAAGQPEGALEGVSILGVDVEIVRPAFVAPWPAIAFMLDTPATSITPGLRPCRVEGGRWSFEGEGESTAGMINGIGVGFDIRGVEFTGKWYIYTGPSQLIPGGEIPTYAGPVLEDLEFVDSLAGMFILVGLQTEVQCVWAEPTLRNVRLPSTEAGIGWVANYSGPFLDTESPIVAVRPTFENIRPYGLVTNMSAYEIFVDIDTDFMKVYAPVFRDIDFYPQLGAGGVITFGGAGSVEGSNSWLLLTEAEFHNVRCGSLRIGDGNPMTVESMTISGASYIDDLYLGDGTDIALTTPITVSAESTIRDIYSDIVQEEGAPSQEPTGRVARVFTFTGFNAPEYVGDGSATNDEIGEEFLTAYTSRLGYRDGDVIQMKIGDYYGVVSWECVNAFTGQWRPLGRVLDSPRRQGFTFTPGTNVTAVNELHTYVGRQPGARAYVLSGIFAVTPTASGYGTVRVNIEELSTEWAIGGFPTSHYVAGVASCYDETTPMIIPGQVRSEVGSQFMVFHFVFGTTTTDQIVTWSATLDPSIPEPS